MAQWVWRAISPVKRLAIVPRYLQSVHKFERDGTWRCKCRMWVRFTLGRRVIGNATYVPACGTGSTSGSMLNIGHGRTATLSNNRVAWLLQFSRITVYIVCCFDIDDAIITRIIPRLNANLFFFFFLCQTNLFTKPSLYDKEGKRWILLTMTIFFLLYITRWISFKLLFWKSTDGCLHLCWFLYTLLYEEIFPRILKDSRWMHVRNYLKDANANPLSVNENKW